MNEEKMREAFDKMLEKNDGQYTNTSFNIFCEGYQAALSEVPARTKLIQMQNEENHRQWYFDCDDLYIDVEHFNGEVSVFVHVRSDKSTGWKKLVEEAQQQEQQPMKKERVEVCETCYGSGLAPNLDQFICPACNGKGV